MAKHTVEYDTENPEDRMALKRSIKAFDMICAINALSVELRNMSKYEEKLDTELLDRFHGKFYNILEDYGINMEDLLD